MPDSVPFGRYLIDRRLAVGGMAEVFLGRIPGPAGFEKQVVIKRILPKYADDPQFVGMFLDEARLAARFNHPNVVQLFELTSIDNQYCIVMEYIHGIDLGSVIEECSRRKTPIPLPLAALIVAEAATGLHYVHELTTLEGLPLNVVHRDVSPSNIIMTWLGSIKVVDFGVAKHRTAESRTQTGVIKGKFPYLAPETLRGERVDRRGDIFSLGAVLYEAITLTGCFWHDDVRRTVEMIRAGTFTPMRELRPDVPAELETLFAEMVEPSPADRPASADAVSRRLRQYLGTVGVPTPAELVALLGSTFDKAAAAIPRRVFGATGDDTEVAVSDDLADPSLVVPEATRVDLINAAARQREAGASQEPTVVLEPRRLATPRAPALGGRSSPRAATRLALAGAAIAVLVGIFGASRFSRKPAASDVRPVAVLQTPTVPPRLAPEVTRPPGTVPAPADTTRRAAAPTVPAAADTAPEVAPGAAPPEPTRRGRERSPEPGFLSLTTTPEFVAFLEGKKLGRTPLTGVKVPAGTHTLVLKNADLGLTNRMTVQVRPGQSVSKTLTLQTGTVIVRVQPWAVVYLEQKRLGTTPLAPITLYEGTYDLLLVNPELGVKKTVHVTINPNQTVGVDERL